MAHLYFTEDLLTASAGEPIEVTGDEARHAVKVSRLRVGEAIHIGNGRGLVCRGEVVETTSDAFTVEVIETEMTPEPQPRVWIVQALAKGDRAERAIELCTEFGAHGFIPWQASRSIAKWNPSKAVAGQQKWQRIAREAAKQSMRPWVPIVCPALTTSALAAEAQDPRSLVVALHPHDATRFRTISIDASVSDVYVCVGPEGGLAGEELEVLRAGGASTAVLGREILRTSSAGAAALASLNIALGRW